MALLQTSQPQLSKAQAQRKAKQIITNGVNSLYRNMLATYDTCYAYVWNNPNGLTPQEVFDSLETDAAELVKYHDDLATAINNAEPDTILLGTPYPITLHNDGTVTVEEPNYS